MTKITFNDGTIIMMRTKNQISAIANACDILNKELKDVKSTKTA